MKQYHTSKLFYGKFPYKIVIKKKAKWKVWSGAGVAGWTPKKIKTWLTSNNIPHKTYAKVIGGSKYSSKMKTIAVSIFTETEADYNNIIQQYRSDVVETTVPANDSHVTILKDNESIVIRKNLIYKKYRYVVSFRSRHHLDDKSSLPQWLYDTFIENREIKPDASDTVKLYRTRWSTRAYFVNEDDLMLVKLTWADDIYHITTIKTFDQLTD